MSLVQSCVDGQSPPGLSIGATRSDGVYLRNLRKSGYISKRYELDNSEPPLYGYKLTKKFWNDAQKDKSNGFSVNESKCIQSDHCSIAINPNSDMYFHVARLDLQELNRMCETQFVVQYDPITEDTATKNLCHFLLLPEDKATTAFIALFTALDTDFPPSRLPATTKEQEKARACVERYQKAVQIIRWVVPEPPSDVSGQD